MKNKEISLFSGTEEHRSYQVSQRINENGKILANGFKFCEKVKTLYILIGSENGNTYEILQQVNSEGKLKGIGYFKINDREQANIRGKDRKWFKYHLDWLNFQVHHDWNNLDENEESYCFYLSKQEHLKLHKEKEKY